MIGAFKRWLRPRDDPAGTPEPDLRVLVVCMGNICRSPSAEGVLRAKLQRAGLGQRVLVDSAGTHGYHAGEPPDPRAVRHAAQRGYDIAALRARPVDPADYAQFDLLLCMDEANLSWLRRHAPPESRAASELLVAHARLAGVDEVPDPYFGSAAGFERVLDILERAAEALVVRWRVELAQRPHARPSGAATGT